MRAERSKAMSKSTVPARRLGRSGGDVLQTIPGIGPSLSEDLRDLGVRAVGDLEGADPQDLYDRLCDQVGQRVDPCVLYAFRCAVYYASNEDHDAELLKWWNWKGRTDA
jgi:hypothetical protein